MLATTLGYNAHFTRENKIELLKNVKYPVFPQIYISCPPPLFFLRYITENYISQASCSLTSGRHGQWEVLVEHGRVGEREKVGISLLFSFCFLGHLQNSCFFSLVLAPTRWASLQGLSSTWHLFIGSSSHQASKYLRTLSPPSSSSSHQGGNFFLLLISKQPCRWTSQLFYHLSNFLLNFIY